MSHSNIVGTKLDCYFDVIGRQSVHNWCGLFLPTDDESYTLDLHFNNKVIKNASQLDIARYKPRVITGSLKNPQRTYIGAKIEFIKVNELTSSFGNIISEVCYTDDGGRYTAFLTKGNYNINIYTNGRQNTIYNRQINVGLSTPYYIIANGMIKDKYKDITSFVGTDYKNIYGQLVNNEGIPLHEAEIIVAQNNQLVAYAITDSKGNYRFALKNGEYTVKIRSKQSPIKTATVQLQDGYGFTEQLTKNNIIFSKSSLMI